MAGQFRSSVWDPMLIGSQIITMQCVFYVCLGLWISLMEVLAGDSASLDYIFNYEEIQFRKQSGRLIIAAFALNSLTCAVGLWYVVRRTKQCLDFTMTVHIFHLLACWIYSGIFPSSLSWWLLSLVCTTLMCVSGEFLCMRTELKAIPVSLGPKADL